MDSSFYLFIRIRTSRKNEFIFICERICIKIVFFFFSFQQLIFKLHVSFRINHLDEFTTVDEKKWKKRAMMG